ncbi:MAG: sugar transferase, partial [Acidimicrobiales bacterium]
IELDLHYIENRSLRLDVEILRRTIRRLLKPEGITGEGGVNPGYPASEDPPSPNPPAPPT